jgi:hypothetical protein
VPASTFWMASACPSRNAPCPKCCCNAACKTDAALRAAPGTREPLSEPRAVDEDAVRETVRRALEEARKSSR